MGSKPLRSLPDENAGKKSFGPHGQVVSVLSKKRDRWCRTYGLGRASESVFWGRGLIYICQNFLSAVELIAF
jgi:hypothetical protein